MQGIAQLGLYLIKTRSSQENSATSAGKEYSIAEPIIRTRNHAVNRFWPSFLIKKTILRRRFETANAFRNRYKPSLNSRCLRYLYKGTKRSDDAPVIWGPRYGIYTIGMTVIGIDDTPQGKRGSSRNRYRR